MSLIRKPYCFTDFDGTLTDNRKRLYRFYTDHAPESAGRLLGPEEFWERKRRGIHELEKDLKAGAKCCETKTPSADRASTKTKAATGRASAEPGTDAAVGRMTTGPVTNETAGQISAQQVAADRERRERAAYDAKKRRIIEAPEYLALDEVFPYAEAALGKLTRKYELILLTRRSHADAFYGEWERTGLDRFFSAVHVIPHSYGGKADFIRENYETDPEKDVIVGDTEDDLRAGRELRIGSFLVLSGIRGDWIVQRYFADYAERIRVIGDIRELSQLL